MNTKNVSEVKEQDEVSKELFKKSDAEKKDDKGNLEEIFLQLTGGDEDIDIIKSLS